MTRIFTILAATDAIFLVLSYTLGIVSKLQDAVHLGGRVYWAHFLVGLASAMITLLVHCLIFTYFLGTGRWVKEVTLAYALPDEPWHKETRELKRRTYPVALIAMLVTIAAAAAGAGAQLQEWPWPVHATLATLALAVNLWAFRLEHRNITSNTAIIEQVTAEVDRICAARGLPSNAERWQQQEQV